MRYGLTQFADSPTCSVMTLAEAKLHLRVDFDTDDELILGLIEAATLQAEAYCGAAFCARDYLMTLGAFPGLGSGSFGPDRDGEEFKPRWGSTGRPARYTSAIYLPVHPLLSVSSIQYLDTDNVLQTFDAASYVVVTTGVPPFVVPVSTVCWPAVYSHPEAVRISFRAGFATIPQNIVAAVKLYLGHLYEHREEVTPGVGAPNPVQIPLGAKWLLNPHKVWPL